MTTVINSEKKTRFFFSDLSEKKSEFIPNNLVFTTSGVLHDSWSVGPTPGFDVMPLFLS
jgi:hypothetical protein